MSWSSTTSTPPIDDDWSLDRIEQAFGAQPFFDKCVRDSIKRNTKHVNVRLLPITDGILNPCIELHPQKMIKSESQQSMFEPVDHDLNGAPNNGSGNDATVQQSALQHENQNENGDDGEKELDTPLAPLADTPLAGWGIDFDAHAETLRQMSGGLQVAGDFAYVMRHIERATTFSHLIQWFDRVEFVYNDITRVRVFRRSKVDDESVHHRGDSASVSNGETKSQNTNNLERGIVVRTDANGTPLLEQQRGFVIRVDVSGIRQDVIERVRGHETLEWYKQVGGAALGLTAAITIASWVWPTSVWPEYLSNRLGRMCRVPTLFRQQPPTTQGMGTDQNVVANPLPTTQNASMMPAFLRPVLVKGHLYK